MKPDDRIEIQECPSKEMTFNAIGKRIGKNSTTVSGEIKIYMGLHTNSFARTNEVCLRISKAPFICNGCEKKSCNSRPCRRQMYIAKKAQVEYDMVLVKSRVGIFPSNECFYETGCIVSEAIQNGKHIYQIIKFNNLPILAAAAYRHIKKR